MNGRMDSTDFERTLRTYEFTRRAERQVRNVVESDVFSDMPSDEIFRALTEEIQKWSFSDYLKRYLYEHAAMTDPFESVQDSEYLQMIQMAFEENNAPRSFEPTTTKWTATVKSWLNSSRVRRETVFLLGFGLRMSARDVSDFLIKGLQEDDFRDDDADEVIYQFCFAYQQPYSRAVLWRKRFETLAPDQPDRFEYQHGEKKLAENLLRIKSTDRKSSRRELAWNHFERLYDECRKLIAEIYQSSGSGFEEDVRESKSRPEDVTPFDLEQIMCSGIPRNDAGNLVKSSLSRLNDSFQAYRPGRQRIDGILKRKQLPDRYDLITLLFFIYAVKTDMDCGERREQFEAEANRVLAECGMGPVYITNPYEAFIVICILSDEPLSVYGDIWELSYDPDAEL